MIIRRYSEPNISLTLIPFFLEVEKTRLDMGWELHERLKNNPQDTLCAIAIENNKLHGILIAYLKEDSVWIWQARANGKFRKYSSMVQAMLEEWAKYKNCNEIRCKPSKKRTRRYFCKRYGYKLDGEEIVKSLHN